jgi:hypothetical protein
MASRRTVDFGAADLELNPFIDFTVRSTIKPDMMKAGMILRFYIIALGVGLEK